MTGLLLFTSTLDYVIKLWHVLQCSRFGPSVMKIGSCHLTNLSIFYRLIIFRRFFGRHIVCEVWICRWAMQLVVWHWWARHWWSTTTKKKITKTLFPIHLWIKKNELWLSSKSRILQHSISIDRCVRLLIVNAPWLLTNTQRSWFKQERVNKQRHKQMDGWTNGCFQMYYLPCYTVDKND